MSDDPFIPPYRAKKAGLAVRQTPLCSETRPLGLASVTPRARNKTAMVWIGETGSTSRK